MPQSYSVKAAVGVAGLKSFGEFQQQLNTAAVVAGGMIFFLLRTGC